MADMRLGPVESRFAELIWDGEPISSTELVHLAERELEWKKSTTYTVIKRLTERGVVKTEDAVVTALVSRDEVQRAESRAFVERNFSGSLPGFLNAFVGGRGLSAEEAEELRRMIAAFEEKHDE